MFYHLPEGVQQGRHVHGQLVCPVWSLYMVSLFVLFDHCTWSACPVWSQCMVSLFVLFEHGTWSACLSCLIMVHGQLVCPVWSWYMVSLLVVFDHGTWSVCLSCLNTVHGQLVCPVWSWYMISLLVVFQKPTRKCSMQPTGLHSNCVICRKHLDVSERCLLVFFKHFHFQF